MKNDMPELKACPFCGSKPRVSPKDPKIEGDAWTQIRCVKCDIGFTAYADTGHYNKAANKWNTRTDLATPNQCCGARGKEACTRYDQDGEECDVKRAGVDDGLLAEAVKWIQCMWSQVSNRSPQDDEAMATLLTHALKTREKPDFDRLDNIASDSITELGMKLVHLEQMATNVIRSWKRGDISTTGTALLELENAIKIINPPNNRDEEKI